MRKYVVLILALACLGTLVGCGRDKTVNIDFPFEVEDVTNVEMYHYVGVPVSAEKKLIIEEENIKTLYDKFEKLSLEIKEVEETTGAEVTSFRFNISDGTNYELIYVNYGVKKGVLKSVSGNFEYFTSADIAWNWSHLNEELQAVSVDESELP